VLAPEGCDDGRPCRPLQRLDVGLSVGLEGGQVAHVAVGARRLEQRMTAPVPAGDGHWRSTSTSAAEAQW
jgi:hypothetical protein